MNKWYLHDWTLNSSDEIEINIVNIATNESKNISGEESIKSFASNNTVLGLDIAGGVIMPHVYTRDMVDLEKAKLPANVRIKIAGRNWINAVITYRDPYRIKFIVGGNEVTLNREYLVQHELEIDLTGRSLNDVNKFPDVAITEYFPKGYVHADVADAEKKRQEEELRQQRIKAREAEKARYEAEIKQKELEKEAKRHERKRVAEQKKLDKQQERAEYKRKKLEAALAEQERKKQLSSIRIMKIDSAKLRVTFKPFGKITGFEIWISLHGGVFAIRRTDSTPVKVEGHRMKLQCGEILMIDVDNIKALESWFVYHVKNI